MTEYFKKNGIQLLILGAGLLMAWATLSARVDAIEGQVAKYPGERWFVLKFETIDQQFEDLNKKLDEKVSIVSFGL